MGKNIFRPAAPFMPRVIPTTGASTGAQAVAPITQNTPGATWDYETGSFKVPEYTYEGQAPNTTQYTQTSPASYTTKVPTATVAPAATGTPQAPAANPPVYSSVADMGYSPTVQQQLAGYGITNLPSYMNFSGKSSDQTDIARQISDVMGMTNADIWSAYGRSGSGKAGEAARQAISPTLPVPDKNRGYTLSDSELEAFRRAYMTKASKENQGGFGLSEALGMGVVLAPIAAAAAIPALAGGAAVPAVSGVGGLAGPELSAMTGALGPMSQADLIAAAVASGGAAGADVGMGAGTGWLTSLGLPASVGSDFGALLGYGGEQLLNGLGGINLGNLLGAGIGAGLGSGLLPGMGVVSQPTNIMAGTTSAPQTSPIAQGGGPITSPSYIAPTTAPTGSIMGAFADNSGDTPDYLKYLSPLF